MGKQDFVCYISPMSETTEQSVIVEVSHEGGTDIISSETFLNKEVGINEAASITGRGKGQIGRDSNKGRLPFRLNEKGHKCYKVFDLHTLYGLKKPKKTSLKTEERPVINQAGAHSDAIELVILRERLQAQEKTMLRMEHEIMDLRQNRDRQLETIERLTLLLPAPQKSSPTQPALAPTDTQKKSIWQRLFS